MRSAIGLGDVADDPAYRAALDKIIAQMRREGATSLDISAASDLFKSAFTGLYSGSQGSLGITADANTALTAASQFVIAGKTVSGAAAMIDGLVSTAQTQSAPQVVQAFTGTLVALGVAAGVVTAGVGAAIVGAVGVTLTLLAKFGLFGNENPGTDLCGVRWSPPPAWTVGCWGMYGDRHPSPNSLGWRKFPEPGGSIDGVPFFQPHMQGSAAYPIEMAFPEYNRIVCDLSRPYPPEVKRFYKAFFSAWKANNEFALNGLKAQSDWEVFAHTLTLWNRANSSASRFEFGMSGPDTVVRYEDQRACKYTIPYVAVLVEQIRKFAPNGGAGLVENDRIYVNTGGSKTVIRAPALDGLVPHEGLSTAAKVAIVVPVTAAAGTAIYAWLTHQAFSTVVKKLLRKVGGDQALSAAKRRLGG